MIQVKNRACVRTIAVRSLRASRMRNRIAVIAIMLTTMLFTALFTIAISINDSFQQSNFLMAGGDAHGSFKKLTEEQMETLKKDPLIRETGARLFLGMEPGMHFARHRWKSAIWMRMGENIIFAHQRTDIVPKREAMKR